MRLRWYETLGELDDEQRRRRARQLINRLRDVSEAFVPVLARAFERLGPPGVELLRVALKAGLPNPAARRARQILASIKSDGSPLVRLSALAENAYALDVGTAAMLLAIYEDPENADPRMMRGRLRRFGRALRIRLDAQGAESAEEVAETASEFFFRECQFQLNDEDFYRPENTHLHQILRTRYGIPVSLAAVMIAVTDRAEVPFEGINFPGHFLVSYRHQGREVIMDPSNGRRLSLEDVREMAARHHIPFEPVLLHPVSTRELLLRILNSLIAMYRAEDDLEGLRRCLLLHGLVGGQQT